MRVSLDILFRVSLFNRLVIEKPLLQITNMEHIFSASLLSGGLPYWLRVWLPFNYFKIVSLGFPVCLLVFGAVMPLNINSFGMDITCKLTRHWFATANGEEIPFLPVRIELSVYL